MSVSHIYTMVCLLLFSFSDLKSKSVSMLMLVLSYVGAAVLLVVLYLRGESVMSYMQLIIILTVGVVCILIAALSRMIGIADCMTFILIGILNGLIETVGTILLSMFMVSICAILLLLAKKMRLKDELPFIPFITASFLGVWLCI